MRANCWLSMKCSKLLRCAVLMTQMLSQEHSPYQQLSCTRMVWSVTLQLSRGKRLIIPLILIKTCQTPLTFFLNHPFQNILVIRLAAFKYLKYFSIVLMLYGTNFECFFFLSYFTSVENKKSFSIFDWLIDLPWGFSKEN